MNTEKLLNTNSQIFMCGFCTDEAALLLPCRPLTVSIKRNTKCKVSSPIVRAFIAYLVSITKMAILIFISKHRTPMDIQTEHDCERNGASLGDEN